MKLKKDVITGICGLIGSALFFGFTVTGIREIPNALEPGPRLMPYLALAIIAICSVGMIVKSLRENTEEKPYFPPGGVKHVTICFITLILYGIALALVGFLPSTPFAMVAFIYLLKGENKFSWVKSIIIALAVTACLYLMFVKGFSIKLPAGILF